MADYTAGPEGESKGSVFRASSVRFCVHHPTPTLQLLLRGLEGPQELSRSTHTGELWHETKYFLIRRSLLPRMRLNKEKNKEKA